ncbi:ATP-binding protein [Microtetraspora fusca]|uniref:ATP-binding protein n=1 Tax=Microtetraspora fusca TaxID=1997 RepID=A0ABW6VE31_MICFU
MTLTTTPTPLTAAALGALSGDGNILVAGPPQSGKTSLLAALVESYRQEARVYVLGAFKGFDTYRAAVDGRRVGLGGFDDKNLSQWLDDPTEALGPYDGIGEVIKSRMLYVHLCHEPIVVVWDNLNVFHHGGDLDKLVALSRRINVKVIAAITTPISPMAIYNTTTAQMATRVLLAPHREKEHRTADLFPWYELTHQPCPRSWEMPRTPGTALITPDATGEAPLLYTLAGPKGAH